MRGGLKLTKQCQKSVFRSGILLAVNDLECKHINLLNSAYSATTNVSPYRPAYLVIGRRMYFFTESWLVTVAGW